MPLYLLCHSCNTETEAYKNLLAGNRPVQTAVADDTDNSDNDLEKQFVSTLSPRSQAR